MDQLLLLAILLSGCAGVDPAARPPATETEPAAQPPSIAIAACSHDCFEPAIAIDQSGRIFVVAAHEPNLAVSSDGGKTFERRRTPPVPAQAAGSTQWDGTVAAGPGSRLHYYAFLAHRAPEATSGLGVPALPGPPIGIQVATSIDGAVSWDSNVFLSITQGTEEPVASPWKSWIGFGTGSTVYLNYNSRGTGLWNARSDDHGRTWHDFTRVSPHGDRLLSVFMSPPVVDAEGRVHMAYFGEQSPNAPNPFLFRGHELRLAVSENRGRSFSHHVISARPPPDYVGTFFPTLAADSTGTLLVAYLDPDRNLQMQASFDSGKTWAPAQKWSQQPLATSPWLVASNGTLFVAFQQQTSISFAKAPIPADKAPTPVPAQALTAESTSGSDFTHFAVDPAGRIVVPVGNRESRQVKVAFGPWS